MKKVTLLGDSIRLGYQETVRSTLESWAEVWAPAENCMHSIHHLFNLAWYLEKPADVIHFNFGLWDCRRLGGGSGEPSVPLDLFVRNLEHILRVTRARSSAELMWATITPVSVEAYNAKRRDSFGPWRLEGDCEAYNAAALPVLARYNVLINDLYGFVIAEGQEKLIGEDGIHFTEGGYEKLGMRAAKEILKTVS